LTDTSLFIYIRVKHFGMANIKKKYFEKYRQRRSYSQLLRAAVTFHV